jgi:hypothetical protein
MIDDQEDYEDYDDLLDDLVAETEPEYTTPIKSLEEIQENENELALRNKVAPKVMTQFDVIIDSLSGRHAERFNYLMQTMSSAEFIKAYSMMLGYVRPKFKSLEPKVDKPKVTKLTIVRKTISEEDRTLPKINDTYKKQIKNG